MKGKRKIICKIIHKGYQFRKSNRQFHTESHSIIDTSTGEYSHMEVVTYSCILVEASLEGPIILEAEEFIEPPTLITLLILTIT